MSLPNPTCNIFIYCSSGTRVLSCGVLRIYQLLKCPGRKWFSIFQIIHCVPKTGLWTCKVTAPLRSLREWAWLVQYNFTNMVFSQNLLTLTLAVSWCDGNILGTSSCRTFYIRNLAQVYKLGDKLVCRSFLQTSYITSECLDSTRVTLLVHPLDPRMLNSPHFIL